MGTGKSGRNLNTHGAKADRKDNAKDAVKLPENRSQICHIFGERPGHLPDTPANRELLTNLANDSSKFQGTDKYGNSWNAEIASDGSQNWVRYRSGIINEGGKNIIPRNWDKDRGLNNNPFKRKDDL